MVKKLSANQIAFKKQQTRIKKLVTKLESQGYQVDKSIIPKTPARVTKKQLQQIQNIKPKQIRESAFRFEGFDTITAQEDLSKKRSKASKKSWEERRRKKDMEEYNKVKSYINEPYTPSAQGVNEGTIIYYRILDLIHGSIEPFHQGIANEIERALQHEIDIYGFDTEMESLSQIPEKMVQDVDIELYYLPEHLGIYVDSACRALLTMITGTALTMEQSIKLTNQTYGE